MIAPTLLAAEVERQVLAKKAEANEIVSTSKRMVKDSKKLIEESRVLVFENLQTLESRTRAIRQPVEGD